VAKSHARGGERGKRSGGKGQKGKNEYKKGKNFSSGPLGKICSANGEEPGWETGCGKREGYKHSEPEAKCSDEEKQMRCEKNKGRAPKWGKRIRSARKGGKGKWGRGYRAKSVGETRRRPVRRVMTLPKVPKETNHGGEPDTVGVKRSGWTR